MQAVRVASVRKELTFGSDVLRNVLTADLRVRCGPAAYGPVSLGYGLHDPYGGVTRPLYAGC